MITAAGCLERAHEAKIKEILDAIKSAADSGQYQISFKDLTDQQVKILQSLGFYAVKATGPYLAGVSWRKPYATNND